ncbi:sigma factor G inhibitor Gin [Clostridium tarantellae]|uniref:Carnitine--CoA ligase n=1 Tax=Clostridium tarantellae TaxID=39493 RepID=A0A6I1MQR0_9CLOT|nr:sigma factor G inhibitor Gin [Clostridium tarantellae]MPQ45133.1 carnitine--CoA ligase [Clostridium tarantellae]
MKEVRCIICEKEGYGIIIRGMLICNNCEEKVITCDVNSDFYEFYKNKLKEKIYKKKLG